MIGNSDFSDLYFSTLEKYIVLGTKEFGIKLSVLHWINDVLMAIFFFFCIIRNKERIFTRRIIKSKASFVANYWCGRWNGCASSVLYHCKYF